MLLTLLWLGKVTALGAISVLTLLWLYKELTMGICRSKKRLEGKVAIVTGAVFVLIDPKVLCEA